MNRQKVIEKVAYLHGQRRMFTYEKYNDGERIDIAISIGPMQEVVDILKKLQDEGYKFVFDKPTRKSARE